MKMSKRSIIITCIILTVIIIGTLIFYIERIHEPKLTEENIVNNTLRAAGGEKELLRAAAQGPGHIGPPLLQPLGRLDARGIAGGGIAPQGGHGLHSRLDRLGPHRRGGRVIQIMCHGVSFLSQYETIPF